MHLERIRISYEHEDLMRVLNPIGEGISQCGEIIDQLSDDQDTEYVDAVIDQETSVIESLLGTAFVICQTFITSVVSRIKALHDYHNIKAPRQPLETTTGDKQAILRFNSQLVGDSDYSYVQVIDAFANYFKHNEEWHGDWCNLPYPSNRTVAVIQAIGAKRGSTGNLRDGAKVLGNKSFQDISVFYNIVNDWSKTLYDYYSQELQTKGLI